MPDKNLTIEDFDKGINDITDRHIDEVLKLYNEYEKRVLELVEKVDRSDLPDHLVAASLREVQRKIQHMENKQGRKSQKQSLV